MITVKLTAEQIESIKYHLTFNFNQFEKTMTQLIAEHPEHADSFSHDLQRIKQEYLDQIQAFDDGMSDAYTDDASSKEFGYDE